MRADSAGAQSPVLLVAVEQRGGLLDGLPVVGGKLLVLAGIPHPSTVRHTGRGKTRRGTRLRSKSSRSSLPVRSCLRRGVDHPVQGRKGCFQGRDLLSDPLSLMREIECKLSVGNFRWATINVSRAGQEALDGGTVHPRGVQLLDAPNPVHRTFTVLALTAWSTFGAEKSLFLVVAQ